MVGKSKEQYLWHQLHEIQSSASPSEVLLEQSRLFVTWSLWLFLTHWSGDSRAEWAQPRLCDRPRSRTASSGRGEACVLAREQTLPADPPCSSLRLQAPRVAGREGAVQLVSPLTGQSRLVTARVGPVTHSHFPTTAGGGGGGPVRGPAGRRSGVQANTSATRGEGPPFPSRQAEEVWDSHLSAASAPGSSAGCQRPHVFEPGSCRGAPRRRSSPTEAPPSLQPDPLPGDARGLRRVLRGVPRGDSPCVFSPRVEMGAQRAPRFRAAAAARSLCLPVPTRRDTRPSALERRPGFPGSPHSAPGPATPRLSPESTVAGGSRSGPGGTFRVSREHAPINRPEDGRALERRSGASPQGVALGPRETYIPSGCLSFLPVKQGR